MRYPEHAAETTARFIKSPIGVRQALYAATPESVVHQLIFCNGN